MTGFVLHPEAYTDLDEIWEYIAADNIAAADHVLDEIYQTLHSLSPFLTRDTPAPTSPHVRYGFNQYESM